MSDTDRISELEQKVEQLQAMLDLFELDRSWQIDRTVEARLHDEYQRGRRDGGSSRPGMIVDDMVRDIKTRLEAMLPEVIQQSIPDAIHEIVGNPAKYFRPTVSVYVDPVDNFNTHRFQTVIDFPETRIQSTMAINSEVL